jgi:hypothetical protein
VAYQFWISYRQRSDFCVRSAKGMAFAKEGLINRAWNGE